MDAVLMHGSKLRNPRKIYHPFISGPLENFSPEHSHAAGLLQPPPHFLSQSYPPYSLQQQPPQPPLLPLPATNPRRSAATYPPANRKPGNGNRARDVSLTPRKLKSPKKEEKISPKRSVSVSSTGPLGPEPRLLPRDGTTVLPFISSASGINRYNSFNSSTEDEVGAFSGSAAFAISPPPSSLPLPTFSLRPKLSCKAEAAAGIDASATDDLRRLLRLR